MHLVYQTLHTFHVIDPVQMILPARRSAQAGGLLPARASVVRGYSHTWKQTQLSVVELLDRCKQCAVLDQVWGCILLGLNIVLRAALSTLPSYADVEMYQ